jgi:hypothetical protein
MRGDEQVVGPDHHVASCEVGAGLRIVEGRLLVVNWSAFGSRTARLRLVMSP